MVHRFRLAAPVYAEIVRDLGQMDEVLAHVDARFADLAEPVGALHVKAFSRRHRRKALAGPLETLHVQIGQLGLRVESVDMARTAFHHQEDAGLGSGPQMRPLGGQRATLAREQVAERDAAQGRAERIQEAAPGVAHCLGLSHPHDAPCPPSLIRDRIRFGFL